MNINKQNFPCYLSYKRCLRLWCPGNCPTLATALAHTHIHTHTHTHTVTNALTGAYVYFLFLPILVRGQLYELFKNVLYQIQEGVVVYMLPHTHYCHVVMCYYYASMGGAPETLW